MSLYAHGLVHSHEPLPFRLLGLAHALAEHHNQERGCFPKLATLAARGETNERTVRRMLAELEDRGVVRRVPTLDASGRQISNGYEFLPSGVSILSGGEDTGVRGEGDTGVLPINSNKETYSSAVAEDSGPGDHQCPRQAEEKTKKTAACPYEQIRALWERMLPNASQPLPVENWTAQRKAQIRARWQNELPTLEHWERTFEYIRASPFLMGKTEPSNGRRPFRITLWWISKPENLSKLYEGVYDA